MFITHSFQEIFQDLAKCHAFHNAFSRDNPSNILSSGPQQSPLTAFHIVELLYPFLLVSVGKTLPCQ